MFKLPFSPSQLSCSNDLFLLANYHVQKRPFSPSIKQTSTKQTLYVTTFFSNLSYPIIIQIYSVSLKLLFIHWLSADIVIIVIGFSRLDVVNSCVHITFPFLIRVLHTRFQQFPGTNPPYKMYCRVIIEY